jgi:hypothetical protein
MTLARAIKSKNNRRKRTGIDKVTERCNDWRKEVEELKKKEKEL